MGRLRVLGTALVLAGCIKKEASQSLAHGDGSGGTPTTITAGDGGQVLDDDPQPTCCVKDKAAPWEGLSWVQITTDPGEAGSCPEPTMEGFKAYTDMAPLPSHTCGACSCSPAACTLPEGIQTNAAKCADAAGSFAVPLGPDPAAGWEGVCSDDGALPANLQCSGIPCAQSVSVPSLSVTSCKAESGPAEPFPAPTWAKTALQCKIEPLSGDGCESGYVCAPHPPEGFALCLSAKGELPACPPEYPVRMVFYQGVKDERGCEACQCSPQSGAECMAIVSAFSDDACGSFAGGVVVTDQEAACFDVISGTALGSMEASMVVDVPGSCTSSGGAPFGDIEPADPLTLCCQGDQEPPQ